MKDFDFTVDYNDLTLIETEANFPDVQKIMNADMAGRKEWMISSNIYITHKYGTCVFGINMWHNKTVDIVSYVPSTKEIIGSDDLQCLSFWCQELGWDCPKVSEPLVLSNIKLWKYIWSVNLVESDYLDKTYQNRENIVFED